MISKPIIICIMAVLFYILFLHQSTVYAYIIYKFIPIPYF